MIFGRQFLLTLSAVQLHMTMLNMIAWHRRAKLKNKEIILHLTRIYWVKQGSTFTYFLCFKIPETFQIITRLRSSVQVKYISGDSFKFTFFFGSIFYQMCLTDIFLCVFIKFSRRNDNTRINNKLSTHRQDN